MSVSCAVEDVLVLPVLVSQSEAYHNRNNAGPERHSELGLLSGAYQLADLRAASETRGQFQAMTMGYDTRKQLTVESNGLEAKRCPACNGRFGAVRFGLLAGLHEADYDSSLEACENLYSKGCRRQAHAKPLARLCTVMSSLWRPIGEWRVSARRKSDFVHKARTCVDREPVQHIVWRST